MQEQRAVATAVDLIDAPVVYTGKVRELYDLKDNWLIVVTDRISAFDWVLEPAVPDKGRVLNQLSVFWFEKTKDIIANHIVHADVAQLPAGTLKDVDALKDRFMVSKKADRIDIECVVRGYITGGGWRQYQQTGEVNGIPLSVGLRKNERLPEPIFTPAAKNDIGHDEDISFDEMCAQVGRELAIQLRDYSIKLYKFAHEYCAKRGIILADCKFEFGIYDNQIILIDEIFTPDSSRFWAEENYALDIEIDSMDKEPVRTYLANTDWDKNSKPAPLPDDVIQATRSRYLEIWQLLVQG